MALAAAPAVTFPRDVRLPTWCGGIAVISACLTAFALLVPPALAAPGPGADSVPVSVRLVGQVSVAGLPGTPAVSRLSVRNDGAAPISWSVRTSISGSGAPGVRIETWVPGERPCTPPTPIVALADWSRDPVQPGGTIDLCVRVTASATPWGTAIPSVTVVARPAGT